MLDSGAERPGFKSQPRHCRVTVLGKLFTPIVPLFTKQNLVAIIDVGVDASVTLHDMYVVPRGSVNVTSTDDEEHLPTTTHR